MSIAIFKLQLADFLGHNANDVEWEVWMALLAYVLLHFCAHLCPATISCDWFKLKSG